MIHGPLVRKYHDGITIRSGSSWTTYRYRYNFQIDDMWSQSKIETIARITNSIIFSLKILHTHIARWYDNLFSSNPSLKCSCQIYFSYRHHTLFSIYSISYTVYHIRNIIYRIWYTAGIRRTSVLAVLDFQIRCSRPETSGFRLRCLLNKHECHRRKLRRPRWQ